MKLTNRLNLPEPIVNAVANDGYTRGGSDISVTQLLTPPRIVALRRQHEEEISEDVSDRIWSLLGQSIHTILERANATGIAERRLEIEIEGWKVSGGMDLVCKDGILSDYKVTTAYKFKDGKAPLDFEQQLNCYAAILRANGETVQGLQIVGILRDWSKLEAARDPNFPQSQVVIISIPMWPEEIAKRFLRDRVVLHQQARLSLPLCSTEDRWAKPDTFAVKKQGAARASRVYPTEDEAIAHAKQDSALFVEKRAGENTRCKHYCPVSRFCQQFAALEGEQMSEWTKPSPLGQGRTGT
jgi:hypothetical protein